MSRWRGLDAMFATILLVVAVTECACATTSPSPFGDTCNITNRVAYCSNKMWTTFNPETAVLPYVVTQLDLNNNQIRYLSKTMFAGLERLEVLNIPSNIITKIENNTFSNLLRLIQIDLSFNQIDYVNSTDIFRQTPLIKIIDLDGNDLKLISEYTFQGLKTLQEVRFGNLSNTICNYDSLRLVIPSLANKNILNKPTTQCVNEQKQTAREIVHTSSHINITTFCAGIVMITCSLVVALVIYIVIQLRKAELSNKRDSCGASSYTPTTTITQHIEQNDNNQVSHPLNEGYEVPTIQNVIDNLPPAPYRPDSLDAFGYLRIIDPDSPKTDPLHVYETITGINSIALQNQGKNHNSIDSSMQEPLHVYETIALQNVGKSHNSNFQQKKVQIPVQCEYKDMCTPSEDSEEIVIFNSLDMGLLLTRQENAASPKVNERVDLKSYNLPTSSREIIEDGHEFSTFAQARVNASKSVLPSQNSQPVKQFRPPRPVLQSSTLIAHRFTVTSVDHSTEVLPHLPPRPPWEIKRYSRLIEENDDE